MSKVVSGIGKVAGVAAPFIPGPWGAVAGAAGSMAAGSEANNKANALNGDVQKMAQQQAQGFNSYYLPMLQAYAQQSGYNPATKTFDPNFDPYQGAVGSAMYNRFAEGTDQGYDQAANQLSADSMARGFTGYNAALGSQQAMLRRDEGQNLAGARRDIMLQGDQERFQRIASMLPMLNSAGQSSMSTLGGLGANYASKAGNIGAGLGNLAGALGQTGVLSGWLGQKKRTQSSSMGTSAANATGRPSLSVGNVMDRASYGGAL